jgi:hypothetical protein
LSIPPALAEVAHEDTAPVNGRDRTHPPRRHAAHWIVAGLCLTDPVTSVLSFQETSGWFDALAALLMLVQFGACIWALRVQRRDYWPPLLSTLPYMALGTALLALFLGIALSLVAVIVEESPAQDIELGQIPMLIATAVATSGLNLAMGLVGVRELLRLRAPSKPASGNTDY